MDFLANQECSILPPTPGDSNRVERVRQRSKAEKFTWFAQNVKYVLIKYTDSFNEHSFLKHGIFLLGNC